MLVGVGVRFGGQPMRTFGGATAGSIERQRWSQSGAMRNLSTADTGIRPSGRPYGHTAPSSWHLPTSGGAMRAFRTIDGTGTLTGSGAAGQNLTATLTGTGALTAAAQLVVQILATLTGSGSLAVNVNAILQVAATLTGTGSLTGSSTALAHLAATLTGTGALTAPGYATGAMAATISNAASGGELTANEVAAAVWSTGTVHAPGTIGHAVNLVRQLLANKTITDPTTGVQTFYDDDDVTELLAGALWQDAAGTIEYAGAGAERRDRLQ